MGCTPVQLASQGLASPLRPGAVLAHDETRHGKGAGRGERNLETRDVIDPPGNGILTLFGWLERSEQGYTFLLAIFNQTPCTTKHNSPEILNRPFSRQNNTPRKSLRGVTIP